MSDHWQMQFLPRSHLGEASIESNRMLVGNNELIMFLTELVEDKKCGVYKFETTKKQYKKIIDYPQDFTSRYLTTLYHKKLNQIYLYNADQILYQLDMQNREFKEICTKATCKKNWPFFFYLENDIHIIGSERIGGRHFKYMIDEAKLVKLPRVKYRFAKKSILMKTRNSVITTCYDDYDEVRLIEYIDGEWKKWDAKGIHFNSHIICTAHEKYLIFLAGKEKDRWEFIHAFITKSIFVYDMMNKTLLKSPIETCENCCTVMMDRNEKGEDLLVFGYMNELWRTSEFRSMPLLPFYFIRLIKKWVCIERIYMYGTDKVYMINVDIIIQSVKSM